jgi:hypothetical protein
MLPGDVEYIRADIAAEKDAEIERLRELEAAVKALPVEEWVEREPDGSPMLVGYVMQAQGEWDRVRKALAATATEADKAGGG